MSANVTPPRIGMQYFIKLNDVEQIGRSRGRKRIAFHRRAERLQHKSEPRAFKTAVPRQKNFLIFPKRFIRHVQAYISLTTALES